MKIKVIDRKGRDLCALTLSDNDKQANLDIMLQIITNSHLKKKGFDVNRMRLTVGDAKGPALADKKQKFSEFLTGNSLADKDELTLVFKDLGKQISWKLVFLIEYFGPILFAVVLCLFQKQIYGESKPYTFNQKIGLAMVLIHYAKRELETLFVHRFSNDTMPFFNVFKNSTHYWILMGFCSNYFLLHPQYTPPAWASDQVHVVLLVLFICFEFMNWRCHMVLRNLRKPGSTERGIPKGWGFGLVSCANYFWETMCWVTFSLSTQCLGSYLFLTVSFLQMMDWAQKKHRRYKKDFGDKYPKGRKAIVPFFI
uniref:3-oxo-5-alpha-steroid 4-dehydrogenase C-terminal domain-containing protein n=1 Tax=Strombidium inclinatum TaxID=197538 RepID=A0A7S3MVS4_9SPIT|mmetsp:Transcript_18707/g.28673  ORF Transcript_18707/g.28673 Transcript_18707/m.28673 type:complete len:311 (+) Transcript_18707:32-964(+)